MTVPRMIAVAFIFAISAMAWVILGGSTWTRTEMANSELAGEFAGLFGAPQTQMAPRFSIVEGARPAPLPISGSDVTADFRLDQRQRGLMWYSGYQVAFSGAYRVKNPTSTPVTAEMRVAFPDPGGLYDGFAVSADGSKVAVTYRDGEAFARFPIEPGATASIAMGYTTKGSDRWDYSPSTDGVSVVEDLSLTMTTDFAEIDFPEGSDSPKGKERTDTGWRLAWDYDSVVSGRPVAILMPQHLQPGPLASRISFFAPVALLFYFASLVLLTATKDVHLHPMHYAFLAAAFFAFHLLFAYLVDRIDINVAFAVCSVVSVALCVGYLRVVVGANRALVEIAVSQLVFLVLFSYSFFFEGLTGLAVSIGSVLTLAYFMAKTARTDWEAVFAKPERPVPEFARDPRWEPLAGAPPSSPAQEPPPPGA